MMLIIDFRHSGRSRNKDKNKKITKYRIGLYDAIVTKGVKKLMRAHTRARKGEEI